MFAQTRRHVRADPAPCSRRPDATYAQTRRHVRADPAPGTRNPALRRQSGSHQLTVPTTLWPRPASPLRRCVALTCWNDSPWRIGVAGLRTGVRLAALDHVTTTAFSDASPGAAFIQPLPASLPKQKHAGIQTRVLVSRQGA